MANKHHRAIVSCWMLLLVASIDTTSHVFAKNNFGPIPKGTLKSIEVVEDDDVIDCVDINKQPAFNHPLIKGLQVSLQRQTEHAEEEASQRANHVQYPKMYQTWHKYGKCPKGTVPIRRTRKNDIHQKQLYINSHYYPREFAIAVQPAGAYLGTFAYINTWNPKTEPDEYSSAQLWVQAGSTATLASLEAGWIVYHRRYHDFKTRLFIHWTNDNYNKTGCFDLDCSGFVQINHEFALGVPLATSQYNGSIWEGGFSIYKDIETGNWYFKIQKFVFGYWPKSIISQLQNHARTVQWGGEILNNKHGNHHTTTQMGSGHFSGEGKQRAAFIRNLKVVNNEFNIFVDAKNIQSIVWNSKCYDATIGNPGTNYRTHFYFGGPGYSPQCPS